MSIDSNSAGTCLGLSFELVRMSDLDPDSFPHYYSLHAPDLVLVNPIANHLGCGSKKTLNSIQLRLGCQALEN